MLSWVTKLVEHIVTTKVKYSGDFMTNMSMYASGLYDFVE